VNVLVPAMGFGVSLVYFGCKISAFWFIIK